MNAGAEIAWDEELQRRQQAHIVEVWKLLNAWPREGTVTLFYGHGREATGTILQLERDMVALKVREGHTRWVPLLHVDAIDGVAMETAKRLPRPEVDGVVRRRVGTDTSSC